MRISDWSSDVCSSDLLQGCMTATTRDAPRPRYAIYYALPAESALWQRAQAWLGRDCESGEMLAQPALDGWRAAEIAAATASRSDERRVGKECVRTGRSRWLTDT